MRLLTRNLIRILFLLIKTRIPRHDLARSLGYGSLSPYEKFIFDGGNFILHENLKIQVSDRAVILGAYLGDSCKTVNELYGCKVFAFEPVKKYASILQKRFIESKDIVIMPYAASDKDGFTEISVMNDATSQVRGVMKDAVIEVIEARDIVEILDLTNSQYKFMEINIEGAEYVVLERILNAEVVAHIEILLIQFHNFESDSELRRADIRQKLMQSHELIYCYDFVWEKWKRKL